MKRIINGLMYDTDVSDVIFTDEINMRRLYRSQNGRFFMFFQNGEIVPKDEESVKKYLGEHDTEKYIELFGEVEGA